MNIENNNKNIKNSNSEVIRRKKILRTILISIIGYILILIFYKAIVNYSELSKSEEYKQEVSEF